MSDNDNKDQKGYEIFEYYLELDYGKLKMFTISPRATTTKKQANDNNKKVQHS